MFKINDPILDELISFVHRLIIKNNDLLDIPVNVRTLTPVEAIGSPGKWDYPLLRGKEILLQGTFRNSHGQAFTGSPTPFQGRLREVLELDFKELKNKAVFIAVLNAMLRDQGMSDKTIHCHDSEPEKCGHEIASYLKTKYNPRSIGIAGFQPALVSALIDLFGPEKIMVTDLSADNLNRVFKGIEIQDGIKKTAEMISENNILLVTGSVFANDTYEPFYNALLNGKPLYFFGTTVAGIAEVLKLPHLCPLGC